jgi:threonine dehydrogenase-like Zn-dependent dehydrogenase
VGLLAAQLARKAGARVIGVDRYALRLKAAADLGIHVLDASAVQDVAAAVRAATGGRGADAVVEASGSYALLHQAIRTAGLCAQVATVSSYHGDQTGLSLGEEYQRNRITLVPSTTMGGVPHPRQPAWDLARLNATARGFVNDGTLATAEFITHRIPFTDAATAYTLIDAAPETTVKVVLTYDA